MCNTTCLDTCYTTIICTCSNTYQTMATIAELLATSLDALKRVQQNGDFMIVKSSELS